MESSHLASLTHLSALSMQQLAQIAPHASELSVAAGGRMLLDGSLAHELVLVAAGRARVRCAGEVVAELSPGDAFGALAPRRTVYPAGRVTAMTELRLVAFAARGLRLLREQAPDSAAALLAACAAPALPAPSRPRLELIHSAAA